MPSFASNLVIAARLRVVVALPVLQGSKAKTIYFNILLGPVAAVFIEHFGSDIANPLL